MSGCNKPIYRGEELGNACEKVPGGTPHVRSPLYELGATNPTGLESDCDFLAEDDNQLVLEDNGDFLCVDNV